MKVKKITAAQARKINLRNGMETWDGDDRKTFLATDEAEDGAWMFYSKKERDEFVERENMREEARQMSSFLGKALLPRRSA